MICISLMCRVHITQTYNLYISFIHHTTVCGHPGTKPQRLQLPKVLRGSSLALDAVGSPLETTGSEK